MFMHNASQVRSKLVRVVKANDHWNKAPVATTTALGHRYAEALHIGRKTEICENHQTIELTG